MSCYSANRNKLSARPHRQHEPSPAHRRTQCVLAMAAMVAGASLSGCSQPFTNTASPTALRHSWMFGVERMRGDPEPQLPYTNRMIADLAAMPNVQVIFIGNERNQSPFASWQAGKLRISPWLYGEGNCMNITYTILQNGQQQPSYGLVIPPLAAGQEPEAACVDRAATQFYQALVVQGL
jgi:hypothetical protein